MKESKFKEHFLARKTNRIIVLYVIFIMSILLPTIGNNTNTILSREVSMNSTNGKEKELANAQIYTVSASPTYYSRAAYTSCASSLYK